MKNVKLFAPVSSGRTWLGKKIINALYGKVGYVVIIDELILSDNYEYITSDKFIYICLGFTELSSQDIERKKFTAETQERLFAESKNWKDFADKHDLRYFDVTNRDEKTYDNIVEWVKAQV